jgi:hypothetical protein
LPIWANQQEYSIMRNTHLLRRLRPFDRKPNPLPQAARPQAQCPLYQVNLPRQRSRLSRPESKLGLLDAAAGKLGSAGRFLAGCFGVFFSLVILAFLTILGVFGFTAYQLLSNF